MNSDKLSARKKQILRAIVDAHITLGEPVGSKFLSQDALISASAATIRNEMAELEEMGYLVQPHTSAGRVPSKMAYRFYVDSLVSQYSETKQELSEITKKLSYKLSEMDQILAEASRLASSFTDYTGIAFKAGDSKVRVERFDSVYISAKSFHLIMSFSEDIVKSKTIIPGFSITRDDVAKFTNAANLYLAGLTSDEITMPLIMKMEELMSTCPAIVHPAIKAIYESMNELDTADIKVEGVNKLLQFPEYSDLSRLRGLLGVLEEKDKLLDVISRRAENSDDDGINVFIGTEDEGDVMSNTTVIFKNVTVGGKKVSVGVIGPRRMNYQKVIKMINHLAAGIDRMFGQDEGLPRLTDGESEN